VKEAQLIAAGLVKDVQEGSNLSKIFQKHAKKNKINQKNIAKIKYLVY